MIEQELPIVLFVDDEPAIVDSVRMMLEMEQLRLHTAADGREALDRLRSGLRPHLIVSDYRMPKMNGIELIEQARSLTGVDIPVLLTSGDTSRETIERAGLSNCMLLRKPFGPESFLKEIWRHCQQRQTCATLRTASRCQASEVTGLASS